MNYLSRTSIVQKCSSLTRTLLLMYFTLLFIFINGNSQVVNIESKRMQTDSLRFVMRADLSASFNDNDGTYIFQTGTSLSTQVKSKDLNKIFFLLGNHNLIRSEVKDFQNSWFLHFRYNHEITNLFRIESYIQTQHNKLLDVTTRNLIGAGVRFKLISKENTRLYFGNAYMYEVEEFEPLDQQFYNHRNSSYLSGTLSIPKMKLNIINTVYFQPAYSDFSDYRLLEQLKVNISLSKRLSFFTLLDYFFDSITPKDRSQFYFKSKFGLGLKL